MVTLEYNSGVLNRLDKLTVATYTQGDGQRWNLNKMFEVMFEAAKTLIKLLVKIMSRKATNQILQKAKQLKSDEFHGKNIQGYFYFIDESLNKNQNYYKEELQKLSVDYGVPLSLCYGKELFEKLNILQVWDEVLNHLAA